LRLIFCFQYFDEEEEEKENIDKFMAKPPLNYYSERHSLFGGPCSNCFPNSRIFDELRYGGVQNRYVNLLDFPKFGGFKKLSTLNSYDTRELSFPFFSDVFYTWRTPLPHKYFSVYNAVLGSKRVTSTVSKIAKEKQTLPRFIQRQAVNCLCQMKASLSRFICKICGYVLFKIFRRVMKRLLVNPTQLVRIKEAEETGIPIVYLPLHRSHLDYLLITWSVWHFGIRLPHIASGDNLNLSGLGWLLRATGAFFIHRRLDPNDDTNTNEIYRAVLNSYLVEILKSNQSLEFFLEGTRSRFGKTLLPKNGLISNVVDAVEGGVIPDVYLVPVSFSYDNIVEGIFHEELMGIRKEKESVIGVIRGIFKGFGRRGKCGTVTVDFGTPCLLTDYIKSLKTALADNRDQFNLEYSINPNSYRELLPWHDRATPNRTLIRAIGYHIVFDSHQQKPITVSSVIAILLLCLHRERVRMHELARDIAFLCSDIALLGYEVVGWDDKVDPKQAFEDAVTHFRHTILISRDHEEISGTENVWVQLNSSYHSIIDLCYRKNGGIAPFALLSVISMTLQTSNLDPIEDIKNIPVDDLVYRSLSICNLLQTEVIFVKPCENLHRKIKDITTDLIQSMADGGMCALKGQPLSFHLGFYANILRPFLQTLYIVTAYFIQHPNPILKDKREVDFIRRFLLEKSKNRDPGVVTEAYNSDSVYNSIKLLRQKRVIAQNELQVINQEHACHIIQLLQPYIRV
jgi:glycerol-3-phosphate O-acyltransferase